MSMASSSGWSAWPPPGRQSPTWRSRKAASGRRGASSPTVPASRPGGDGSVRLGQECHLRLVVVAEGIDSEFDDAAEGVSGGDPGVDTERHVGVPDSPVASVASIISAARWKWAALHAQRRRPQ
jgi:hypothetical protein